MKNKHKKDISLLSPLTKKKILEVVDYLEKQAEITPSSAGIIYPVIGSDTDDYNDRLIIKKLAEWKVLKILSVDIPSRPNYFEVMTSLEKLHHIKNLLEITETGKLLNNRSKSLLKQKIAELKKTLKLGKKEKSLLDILSDFDLHATKSLIHKVPTKDYKHLKSSLSNRIQRSDFKIETIRGKGLNPSFYKLVYLPNEIT